MSVSENKEVIQRWVNARNTNDLEAALDTWVESWREPLTAGFNGMTNAFPVIHITIEDTLGEGNKVAVLATMTGTHRGSYQNIPATGKQVKMTAIDIYTLENGKIASIVRQADTLGLLKQMGVTISWQGEIIT
jgi:predicted ester cyclase